MTYVKKSINDILVSTFYCVPLTVEYCIISKLCLFWHINVVFTYRYTLTC